MKLFTQILKSCFVAGLAVPGVAFVFYLLLEGKGRQDYLEALTICCGAATLLIPISKAGAAITTSHYDARSGVRGDEDEPDGNERVRVGVPMFIIGSLTTFVLYSITY